MPETNEYSSTDDRAARTDAYESVREDVLRRIPVTATSVLDIGCSSGSLGAAVKARQPATVVGIEIDPAYAAVARERLDRVETTDAETFVQAVPAEAPFDCLVCADVLEHLVDPWAVLEAAASWVAPDGTVIVSLPNALHWRSLARVVRRRSWPRDDWGVFDRTHLRWFSLSDAIALMDGAGLEVEHVDLGVWYVSDATRARLSRLWRTPVGPFLAQQHVLTGRRRA